MNSRKALASFVFGTRLPNLREDAKTEIGFTIPYGSPKSQRHYSIIYPPIRIETRNGKSWLKLDEACHRAWLTDAKVGGRAGGGALR